TRTLSGGEKTKLALARLVLGRHNVLLLDEPTNNLDVQAVEAVRSALETYKGSVVRGSDDTPFVQSLWAERGPAHARRRPGRVERGLPGSGRPGLRAARPPARPTGPLRRRTIDERL